MLEVRQLTKNYGDRIGISDVSFCIEKGHIYGFLGPNGAGKTTTLKLITGCLAATSGQVLVDGVDIFDEPLETKKRIGYLPEQPPVYRDMTVLEYLRFVAAAKGVSAPARDDQIGQIMKKAKIADVSGRLIRNLSKGYVQRVGIAQALVGQPEIIILDEPMVGLDPKQIIDTRNLIQSLSEQHTVLFSSHILSEVRSVCDRIMIIAEGKLLADDTPENLEAQFSGEPTVDLTVKATEKQVKKILSGVKSADSFTYEPREDGAADVAVYLAADRDVSEDIFFAFADARRPILKMNYNRSSLEEVYLSLTKQAERRTEPPTITEKFGRFFAAAGKREGDGR